MMKSASNLWLQSTEMYILSTGQEIGSFAKDLEDVGYLIKHIPFEKNVSFFVKVLKFIKSERFDIVHIHTERASPLFAFVARLALGSSVKIVRTVHHIFRFHGLLRFRKILERLIMKKLLSVTLVSNSISGRQNEIDRFFSTNKLISNWYDDQYYVPIDSTKKKLIRRRLGLPEDKFIYVSLGGNWYYKNYDKIIEAFLFLPPNTEIFYVQIGPQGEGAPLEALATKLKVKDKVLCVGSVDDPRTYLHAADGYLMPSSEEGFGVAAVEAMGSGLPTILGNVKALTDFNETISGIRYIEPDSKSIANEMLSLASLSERDRYKLGNFLAKQVAAEFGLKNGPNGYLKLYRHLISQVVNSGK